MYHVLQVDIVPVGGSRVFTGGSTPFEMSNILPATDESLTLDLSSLHTVGPHPLPFVCILQEVQ